MAKNLSLEDLVGHYDVLATKNQNYAFRYRMTINASAEFSLEEIVSGRFGSTGTMWEGRVVPDQQAFSLLVEKCIDWSDTVVEDERSERVTIVNKRFALLPVPEGLEVVFEQPRVCVMLGRVPKKEKS